MQLVDIKIERYVYLVLLTALLLAVGQANAGNHNGSLDALVEGVYKRYAWVSVFSVEKHESTRLPLKQERLSILRKFFSRDLATAIRADAECSKQSGEICALDFDILFDSQDPEVTDLAVKRLQTGRVEVCFKDQTRNRMCLVHVGVIEDGSPRIADIVYGDGRSLRRLLGLNKLEDRPGK